MNKLCKKKPTYSTLLSAHAHDRRGPMCALAQIAHQTINAQRIAASFALSHHIGVTRIIIIILYWVINIIAVVVHGWFIEEIRSRCRRRKACGRRVLNATSRTLAHHNHTLIFCHFMRINHFFANSSCTTTCLYILF